MSKKKLFYSICGAAAIALLSTGCGGSSGSKTVDLTVSVPTAVSAKKGKHHKEISVTEVKGVLLSDGTEVEGTEDADGNFTVKVPEGSDVRILATVTNENGSEFTFESFVNDATESDQVVDEDSTRIASLILSEGDDNAMTIKELLAQEQDVIQEMNDLLASFNNREYLNEIIASADSEESLDDIKDRIEKAIKKLKRISRLLAKFEERLDQFENSTDIVKFDELTDEDVKDDDSEENENEDEDDDDINEFIARPGNISNIAIGESVSESDLEITINDDGSVSVERGDEVSTTDAILSRGRISGRFISCSSEGLTISVKRDNSILNVDFSFPTESSDLLALAKSLVEGDEVILTYLDVEGKNVLKAIYAEGFLSGTLTALTKTSATITLADGTSVVLPIKVEKVIRPLPLETAKKNLSEVGVELAVDQEVEVTTTSEVETNDLSTLSELEDNNEFEVDSSDVAIGDMVIIHWQIVDNVKVAAGIFPDKAESIEDPIETVDGDRQTLIDGDPVEEEVLGDDGKAPDSK